MFYRYLINGHVIDPDETLFINFFESYGFNKNFISFIEKRLEHESDCIVKELPLTKWKVFLEVFPTVMPFECNIFTRHCLNIYILDLSTSYKGWRHFRGLPVRGQRTWTNAWSCYRSNWILRNLRLSIAKKFYGNIPDKEAIVGFSAEHVNSMWKDQWHHEWLAARKELEKFKGHPKTMKIDLYSMHNYQITHPYKLKNMSKKQKQAIKKNYFTLGFDLGFTKSLLRARHNIEDDSTVVSKYAGASIVTHDERLNRKSKKK